MRIKLKYLIFSFFLINNNIFAYEIIRDPVFENYFVELSKELNLNKSNVYLIKNNTENAFVINNSIYFTTGLLNIIKYEDTLKSIYLHEYGHLIKKHFQSKNVKIQELNKRGTFLNLFSLGLAILSNNANVGIGTNITLNSKLIKNISIHSVNFEIEADNFMINEIKKNNINTSELITFLNKTPDNKNIYFKSHPSKKNRINNLVDFKYNISTNSDKFNWIKSKYSFNSENNSFNLFFKNLEKGLYEPKNNIIGVNHLIIQYEAYKKGIISNNWEENFYTFIELNKNPFLKIEYINYLLDNNYSYKYDDIENLKFDQDMMSEYFYYYIYGKYYNKIGEISLSNFYFCQFFKFINSINKANFFCKKYDIKDIPTLDKSYAVFK